MSIKDRWVAPVDLDTMTKQEREAYAHGLEEAANLFAIVTDEKRLDVIGLLRLRAASARA